MSRRASSLIELMVVIVLFMSLAAILAPLSAQLIRHGQAIANSPGPRVDHLAWELRQAAAAGWRIADDHVLLSGSRWHNTALGVARDGEPQCSATTLKWQRDGAGRLHLILIQGGRPELIIEAPATAEQQP